MKPYQRHDMPLPEWGPYGKNYHGISHIADLERGIRMDLVVAPGRFRRGIRVPSARFESGYAPVEASPDLTYHRWLYALGEGLSMDLVCHQVTAQSTRLQCVFKNTGKHTDTGILHLMPNLQFPNLPRGPEQTSAEAVPVLPAGVMWVNAECYSALRYAVPDFRDRLPYDGHMRGVVRGGNLVNGFAIGGSSDGMQRPFGCDSGDLLVYEWVTEAEISDAWIALRARSTGGEPNRLTIKYREMSGDITVHSECLKLHWLHLGKLNVGQHELRFISGGGSGLIIDGFAVAPESRRNALAFSQVERDPRPQVLNGHFGSSRLIKWADVQHTYGIAWSFPHWTWRQLHASELDFSLPKASNNHTSTNIRGKGAGWFGDVFINPIVVPAGAECKLNALVCCGTHNAVNDQLDAWCGIDPERLEHAAIEARQKRWKPASGAVGVERMAATTLTNVVFPVATRGRYIRHATPGRNWDSLYTWDSGFIALGLGEINPRLSRACIEAYLCDPDDESIAFIHHGSLVPVQFWAAKALFDQFQDLELAAYLFPRLCKMHDFFMGRWLGSTLNIHQSGLLQPWDYFYNSGGWDDYPPQKWLRENLAIRSRTTPVITTAQALRAARILQGLAVMLNESTDVFKADAEVLTEALESHAWNEAEGLYSYIVHDRNGNPQAQLNDPVAGVDFNRGLDGLSPLTCGCLPERASRMFAALADEQRFWTPIGLSTVDKSAPYYLETGYWNGAVWMPHQYFFWRACLDWGEHDLAWRIASTALAIWESEVAASGYCFEHFLIASERGAGWHHFSGLSTPVLVWHGAYHAHNRLTVGSDIWVESQRWADDGSLTAQLRIDGRRDGDCVVLVSDPGWDCQIFWNADEVFAVKQGKALAITLPRKSERGLLQLKKSA